MSFLSRTVLRHAAPLLLFLSAPAGKAADSPSTPEQEICGWTLHVSPELLAHQPTETSRALELLRVQLEEIVKVVPPPAVVELRKVPLWFSPVYPGTQARAEYHPDAGWLKEHGRNPAMAKAVEFTNISIFDAEVRRMPNFTLHELAHAYHDRVWSFAEPRIEAVYEKAKASGKYADVERRDSEGRASHGPAYAMTNAREYFAEGSEAYFSRNDFFPFTRAELKAYDPELHSLLETIWSSSPK